MKRFLITSILATIVAAGTALMAQDYPDEYLGLPGDNLNLYAVMKLFQESETLESFERTLNDENSRINNLDLNNDRYIDYLKVVDYVDGNVHTIVLQAVLDRNESQDVAVFTVEKFRDGSVQIQLIGDEALYGRNYIIEPIFDETPNPGYLGRSRGDNVQVVRTTTVQIAAWPLIRYIYMPNYVVWRSSWYWGYYPTYWHPWRPFYWHYYYGYHYHWYPHYYSYYRHWDRPRYSRWNDNYYSRNRVYSKNVIMRAERGDYKATYSRPQSRRDGEALYAKANPGRPMRQSVSSSGTTGNGRRATATQPTTTRQSGGTTTTTSRRSAGTVTTTRSRSTNDPGQVSTSRRSSGNEAVTRSSTTTRQTTTTSTGNSRRSSTSTGTNSSVSRSSNTSQPSASSSGRSSSSSSQSSGTVRRQSGSSSSGTVSRPSTARESAPARSSSGSSASSSGSSARRSESSSARTNRASSSSSKAASSAKESGKSKESNSSTSRRK